jgi:hypothetical protein
MGDAKTDPETYLYSPYDDRPEPRGEFHDVVDRPQSLSDLDRKCDLRLSSHCPDRLILPDHSVTTREPEARPSRRSLSASGTCPNS